MTSSNHRSFTGIVALLALAGSLAGCASQTVPTDQIAVAERAVEGAERAGAVEMAPVEMRNAREKLQAARSAANQRDAELTDRLAQQAELDAQLAEATARAEKSDRTVKEVEDGLRALQREIQRPAQP